MRKIIRAVPKEFFVCDICGEEYVLQQTADECEKKHKEEKKQSSCKHKYTYSSEINCHDNEDSIIIIEQCLYCEKTDEMVVPLDIISSDVLKKLYRTKKAGIKKAGVLLRSRMQSAERRNEPKEK